VSLIPLVTAAAMRLMTYNVNYGNPDFESALDAIATTDADVVLLQEITESWKTALTRRFKKQYPHMAFHVDRRSAGGLAVLSKTAIEANDVWTPPAGGYFPAGRLVIATAIGSVQILHVHLRPNIDNGNWIVGYQTTPPIRRREIETYWGKIDAQLPTIVAGDFNELPTGKAVEFLASKGLDRVVTKGPTTWHYEKVIDGKPQSLLSMDIDHVVVDKSFTAAKAEVLAAGASDHRPVVVTLQRAVNR